jgi:recombination protein RecR
MLKYPLELTTLIAFLKKLPGVGSKTAERFAFQLLAWPDQPLQDFSALLASIKQKIAHCSECHCLMDQDYCSFCDPSKREGHILCIIASAKDAYSIEETGTYRGLYRALGGLLSPIEGRFPEHLHLGHLKERVDSRGVKEVIIALDSTLEGDTTALYLKDQLHSWGLNVFRLAFGLPMGSSLDFVDGGTLARALTGRQSFN